MYPNAPHYNPYSNGPGPQTTTGPPQYPPPTPSLPPPWPSAQREYQQGPLSAAYPQLDSKFQRYPPPSDVLRPQNLAGDGTGHMGPPGRTSSYISPHAPPPSRYQMHNSLVTQPSTVTQSCNKKKALLIGCNYPNDQTDRLHSCVNDARRMYEVLTQEFGYDKGNVRLLVDDGFRNVTLPTRENIMISMKWLVAGAKCGDKFFFHFSGHGTCSPDYSGDEKRKENQCLMPTDYRQSGLIVDDDINQFLVRPLPEGCTLHALMDCCHSGTVMDLQFSAKNGSWLSDGKTKKYKGTCGGRVFQFAACRDGQRAYGSEKDSDACGAATDAFIDAIKGSQRPTYSQVLHLLTERVKLFTKEHLLEQNHSTLGERMRHRMQSLTGKLSQIPQLSSSTDEVSLNAIVDI